MLRAIVISGIIWAISGAAMAETDLSLLRTQIDTAIAQEDVAALKSAFDPDIQIMPEFQKTMVGPDVATRYYKTLFDGIDVAQFEKTLTETIPIDNLRADIGAFRLAYKPANSPSSDPAEISGSYFDIWQEDASGNYTLLTQGWNFDEAYPDIRNSKLFDALPGVHMAFTPSAPVGSGVSFDLAAVNQFNDAAMLRHQPDILYHVYAEDAVMMPHDSPPVEGREAIRVFLEDYTSHWPSFDYIKSTAHRIEGTSPFVLSYQSYNLRWDSLDNSGISIGKGIRILKRDDTGSLRTYRIISMHDQ